MKTTRAYFKLSVFSPMLFISIVACVPLPFQGTPSGLRPVSPTSDPDLATDEVDYQGAVRAITNRDYGRALDYLQAARSLEANDVRVLNAFGVVYDKLGRFDLSARFYDQALAVEPQSAIVLKNVAYSHVLEDMAHSQGTSPVMAALWPPAGGQTVAQDLPLGQGPVTAPVKLAQDPKILSERAPVRIAAAPPVPAFLTAVSLQIPDLGPVVAPVELAQDPKILPERAPVRIAAVPPVPAFLTAASLQIPDLGPVVAPVELAQDPKILPERAPVRIAAVPPVPAFLTAASLQIPDLAPVKAPVGLVVQEAPRLYRGVPPVGVVAPPSLAIPASISHLPLELVLTRGLVGNPGAMPAPTLAMPQPTAHQAASSHLSVIGAPAVARLERSAEVGLQKSQPAIRSSQEPEEPGRVSVINATGQREISERVRQQLFHLGLTAPLGAASEEANHSYSTIRYVQPDSSTAHTQAIPIPAHLATCVDRCSGPEYMGSNYLEWKPERSITRRWSYGAEFPTSGVERSENDLQ